MRSADGGYSTVETAPRPGDQRPVFPPLPLDELVLVPNGSGDGAAGAGDGSGDGALGAAGAAGAAGATSATTADGASSRKGIFRIPRDYR